MPIRLDFQLQVSSVSISWDSTLVGIGTENGFVAVWNYVTKQHVFTRSHNQAAAASILQRDDSIDDDSPIFVAFSPTSECLASGGDDCKIVLWNIDGTVRKGTIWIVSCLLLGSFARCWKAISRLCWRLLLVEMA